MYEICYQLGDVIVKERVNCDKISIIDDLVYCGDELILDREYFICANKVKESKIKIGLYTEGPTKLLNTGIARRERLW